MLGFYEGFPENSIHRRDLYSSTLPVRKLQQRLMEAFREVNRKTFSFEEVGNPAVPDSVVIFELGIADSADFHYIDDETAQKVADAIALKPMRMMDLFCSIRYYKNSANGKKKPLKFDYYMVRWAFGEDSTVELQIYHERGPRYLSPEDLAVFLTKRINKGSPKPVLNALEPAF
ncbi:MAG: hypothetical protein ACE14S_09355 [Candidatus Bathyarchaeia archaeon]